MADLTTSSPLLNVHEGGGDDRARRRSSTCVQKLIDVVHVEETKAQIIYSLPMILTNLFYYCIPLTSVMFASQLGQLELAGATLANSWATVTGFAVMIGLSGAVETLCGQGFGAKSYKMLGIHLQSSCIVSLIFTILISILWFFTESVFGFFRQDPSISKQAALYLKYQAPGLFAYGFLQNILRFCQTQSIATPLVVFSFAPFVINIGTTYALVYLAGLGFIGAPIATSISLWIAFVSLGIYVSSSIKFKETCMDWIFFGIISLCSTKLDIKHPFCCYGMAKSVMPQPPQSLANVPSWPMVLSSLRRSLPEVTNRPSERRWTYGPRENMGSTNGGSWHVTKTMHVVQNIKDLIDLLNLMRLYCCNSLEYWVFEIFVFLAGMMPNPEINTSLVAICVNTESITYMLTYGLSAVASTRVSNELGAGNVNGAKKATYVSVKLSLTLALVVAIAIHIGHDGLVGLFSNSLEIKEGFASLRFFLVASITLDSIPGVLSGVARGCGWQRLVTVINLGTFYLIGMRIAAFCGFKLKFYAKGLWIGLICGMFCQASSLLLMTIFRKWTKLNATV